MMTSTTTLEAAVESLGGSLSKEKIQELCKTVASGSHALLIAFLQRLAEAERSERDSRNLNRRIQEASLGKFKTIDKFDWNHPKKINRGKFNGLYNMDFIGRHENVLFRGPSGVGKTVLAQNLGWAAIQAGYRVRFTTIASALADLLRRESVPAFTRRLKRYCGPDLLILDELGYVPSDNRAADALYAIISARHETSSTIITTNLAFKQWPTVFPGAACVGALIDRFVQHCNIMDIDAESWRRKDAEERSSAPTRGQSRRTVVPG